MKLIPLSNCADALIVDDEDYEIAAQYQWKRMLKRHHPPYYVYRHFNRRITLFHIWLLGKLPNGHVWDHINRDVLDNRRANLRAVTHQVNVINTGLQRNNSSGYPGVHRQGLVPGKPWLAAIGSRHTRKHLGVFATKEEAIAARRVAELACYGEPCPIPAEAR